MDTHTQLVNFERDEYNSRATKTVKEIQELVKASFEHATEEYKDQSKMFRKHKRLHSFPEKHTAFQQSS